MRGEYSMIINGINCSTFKHDTMNYLSISDAEAEQLRLVLQRWKLKQIVKPIIDAHEFKIDTGPYASEQELRNAFFECFVDSLSDIMEIDGFEDEIEERLSDFVKNASFDDFGIITDDE